jgi:hypothetical protein
MAWKVKNESVNPATGQRMQRGQFLDPEKLPEQEHLDRLKRADAITEAPDAEFEQWKRDEADRQTKAQEDAQRRQQQPNRSTEDRLADLERQVAEMRARLMPPAPAPAIPRGGPGQTTPQQEAAAENEIRRRAGQRPGDDNDQSARKK